MRQKHQKYQSVGNFQEKIHGTSLHTRRTLSLIECKTVGNIPRGFHVLRPIIVLPFCRKTTEFSPRPADIRSVAVTQDVRTNTCTIFVEGMKSIPVGQLNSPVGTFGSLLGKSMYAEVFRPTNAPLPLIGTYKSAKYMRRVATDLP